MMLTYPPDAWWRIRPIRRLLQGMEGHLRRLGCPIRWFQHQHMFLIPRRSAIRLRFPLGLDAGSEQPDVCSPSSPCNFSACSTHYLSHERITDMIPFSFSSVDYEQVTCPAEIVAKSGCSVSGYSAPSPGNPTTSKLPSTTTTPHTTLVSTKTTSTKAQTPTTKASQPSSYSYLAGQGSSSSSVVDFGDSPATGPATVGSASDGVLPTMTTTGTLSAAEVGPTGTNGEEEKEDDTCEL